MFLGAGKTTTFSMLTGDLSITEGTAFMDGFDIQTNLREVSKRTHNKDLQVFIYLDYAYDQKRITTMLKM